MFAAVKIYNADFFLYNTKTNKYLKIVLATHKINKSTILYLWRGHPINQQGTDSYRKPRDYALQHQFNNNDNNNAEVPHMHKFF